MKPLIFSLLCLCFISCGNHTSSKSSKLGTDAVAASGRNAIISRLPSDSKCRIRLIANEGNHAFLGNTDMNPNGFTTFDEAIAFINGLAEGTCQLAAEPCDVIANKGYWVLVNGSIIHSDPYIKLSQFSDAASKYKDAKVCGRFASRRCSLTIDPQNNQYAILRDNGRGEQILFGSDRYATSNEVSAELSKLKTVEVCSP